VKNTQFQIYSAQDCTPATKSNLLAKADLEIVFDEVSTFSQVTTLEHSMEEIGGSNYPFYDMGRYLDSPTKEYFGDLRPIIGTYHLNPLVVYSQLQKMYDAGQRSISFVIWFSPLGNAGKDGVFGHVVDSTGGALRPQHAENLKAVLKDIKNIGFDHVTIRFAQQSYAHPRTWKQWNETQFAENSRFIFSTIDLVKSSTDLPRTFDLGVELAGEFSTSHTREYVKRLWTYYLPRYSLGETYGFSYAYRPGRIAEMTKVYDEVGTRPQIYAVDMYAGVYYKLSDVSKELESIGNKDMPIIIQETFYNDIPVLHSIVSAKRDFGLNIRKVFNWNCVRDDCADGFSMAYAERYLYRDLNRKGKILASPCVPSATAGLCTSTITWTSDATLSLANQVWVDGKLFGCSGAGGYASQNATWIKTQNKFSLYSAKNCEPSSRGELIATILVKNK